MSSFVFRLESLLRYRCHRRDLCQTVLAQLLADDRRLVEQRTEYETQQANQLNEIRHLATEGSFDIDRAASRRYYIGQIARDIQQLEQHRQLVQQQIDLCQQTLLEADREVKVLEKLKEKQRLEFVTDAHKKTARELDDVWLAAHAMEYSQ